MGNAQMPAAWIWVGLPYTIPNNIIGKIFTAGFQSFPSSFLNVTSDQTITSRCLPVTSVTNISIVGDFSSSFLTSLACIGIRWQVWLRSCLASWCLLQVSPLTGWHQDKFRQLWIFAAPEGGGAHCWVDCMLNQIISFITVISVVISLTHTWYLSRPRKHFCHK